MGQFISRKDPSDDFEYPEEPVKKVEYTDEEMEAIKRDMEAGRLMARAFAATAAGHPGEPKPTEHVETWLCWKELGTVEGEEGLRLLTPFSDPNVYEFPMDWLFETEAQAEIAKNEQGPDEDWYLVEMTLKVVAHHPPVPDEAA